MPSIAKPRQPIDFQTLPARIRGAGSILLASHVKPDGDNLGSLLALRRGLLRLGKRCAAANLDPVPRIYRFLPESDRVEPLDRVAGPFDLLIVLDCSDAERPGVPDLRRYAATVVNFDHHVGNTLYGDLNVVESGRSSTCEMVYHLLAELGVPVDREMAVNLFTGLMTDTIRFLTAACTPDVYAIVADLVTRGADPQAIGTLVYMNNSLSGARILAAALRDFDLRVEGRLASFVITPELRAHHGATLEDTPSIVNHLLSVSGIETALVFEIEEGLCHVSMRSKTGFDVGAIARGLGGGGHLNAAGCQLPAVSGQPERVLALVEGRMRDHYADGQGQRTAISAAS